MNFLKSFVEDCKYYDIENIEVKTISKHVKLKDKTILDIGTGIGRLAFPISEYAKQVIAIDKDIRFKKYFKKHKEKNIKFVNKKLEEYLNENKKFDVVLLAWPNFNFKFINLIEKLMDEKSRFIFITCENNSDYETIISKLDSEKNFEKDINDKKRFIKGLSKKFKLLNKEKIYTKYTYPNEKIAFRILKNSMILWFKTRLNKDKKEKLKNIIKNHKKGNKVIFKEQIWFYLIKK